MLNKFKSFLSILQKNKYNTITILFCAYIFFLPFNIGKIVFDDTSWFGGFYINYLQFRITLLHVLNVAIFLLYRPFSINLKIKALLSLLITINFVNSLTFSFTEMSLIWAFISSYKLIMFLLGFYVLLLFLHFVHSLGNRAKQFLFISTISTFVIQLMVVGAQFINKGPLSIKLLHILGQPALFESVAAVDSSYFFRAYGFTAHPNILGGTIGFLLLFGIYLAITKKQKAFILLLGMPVLFATLSKGAIVAFVISAFLYTPFITDNVYKKLWSYRVYVFLCVSIIATLILLYLCIYSPYYSFLTRCSLAFTYVYMFALHPFTLLFGAGFSGSVPYLLTNYVQTSQSILYNGTVLKEPVHSALMLLIFENGFVGAIIYLYTFATLSKRILHKAVTTDVRFAKFIASALLYSSSIAAFDHYLVY